MAVETRRKPVIAMLGNQVMAAVVCFLLTIFAFKWCYNSPLLYVAYILFHLSGIYSYAYSQAKIDLRTTGAYTYRSSWVVGLWGTFWMGVVLILHMIFWFTLPAIAGRIAPFARFWNYPFSFFLYGLENDGTFHLPAAILCLTLPVATSFGAYFLGTKGFSLTEKLYQLIYRKTK